MVIVLMGIVGGMVTVFMRGPVDACSAGSPFGAHRRRRHHGIGAMRADASRLCQQCAHQRAPLSGIIPTKTGGRYRAEGWHAGSAWPRNSFNPFGDNANFAGSALPTDQVIGAGDLVAVYNLGIAGANAHKGRQHLGDHIRGEQAEPQSNITNKKFPLPSASRRFHVIATGEAGPTFVTGITSFRTVGSTLEYDGQFAPLRGRLLPRKWTVVPPPSTTPAPTCNATPS